MLNLAVPKGILSESPLTSACVPSPLVATLAHAGWSLNQVAACGVYVTDFSRTGAVSCNYHTTKIIKTVLALALEK